MPGTGSYMAVVGIGLEFIHSFIKEKKSNQLFLEPACKALAGKSQGRSVGDSYEDKLASRRAN